MQIYLFNPLKWQNLSKTDKYIQQSIWKFFCTGTDTIRYISLWSLHKIISWANYVGRIFWVAFPTPLPLLPCRLQVSFPHQFIFLRGNFWFLNLFSTQLDPPPLRFHCVGGCLGRTQDCSVHFIHSHTVPYSSQWCGTGSSNFAGYGSISIQPKVKVTIPFLENFNIMSKILTPWHLRFTLLSGENVYLFMRRVFYYRKAYTLISN